MVFKSKRFNQLSKNESQANFTLALKSGAPACRNGSSGRKEGITRISQGIRLDAFLFHRSWCRTVGAVFHQQQYVIFIWYWSTAKQLGKPTVGVIRAIRAISGCFLFFPHLS